MAENVAGNIYYEIDGQLHEIKRQLRQRNGYPHNPAALKAALQRIVEGDLVLAHRDKNLESSQKAPKIERVTIEGKDDIVAHLSRQGYRLATLEEVQNLIEKSIKCFDGGPYVVLKACGDGFDRAIFCPDGTIRFNKKDYGLMKIFHDIAVVRITN